LFGIEIADEFVIPFQMSGTTIFFESRVPSQWEMDNCQVFVMTHDSTWDPMTVQISAVAPVHPLHTLATLKANQESPKSPEPDNALLSMSNVYDDFTFLSRAISTVHIHDIRTSQASYMVARNRHSHVSVEEVARKFKCRLDIARQTLKTTTQYGVRHAIDPLHRRYRVDTHNFNRRRLNDVFYSDTLFSKVKSLNGNVCAQVYTNGRYTRVFPMMSKSGECIAQTLREFVDDVGIPNTLICDLASEQVGTHAPMMKEIRQFRIKLHSAKKGRSIQNHRAETEIRELKRRWKARMVERKVPSRLWDYEIVYVAEILSITARLTTGHPGIEEVKGDTIDISEWLDFEFYDHVWYWDEKEGRHDRRSTFNWQMAWHCTSDWK
jgi:hypothetical protein